MNKVTLMQLVDETSSHKTISEFIRSRRKLSIAIDAALKDAKKDALQQLINQDWTEIMREGALVTWGDAETLGDRVVALIQEKQKC